jgi:Domain of unknown function (DUF4276)
VEGGGDHNKALQTECRRGFSEFLRKAGLEGRLARVVACGSRSQTYDKFRIAHEGKGADDLPILLVDSEAPVTASDSWQHVRLRQGDEWERPQGASDDQVQALEAWFHADKEKLQEYYGQGFRMNALSPRLDIEKIPKDRHFYGFAESDQGLQER